MIANRGSTKDATVCLMDSQIHGSTFLAARSSSNLSLLFSNDEKYGYIFDMSSLCHLKSRNERTNSRNTPFKRKKNRETPQLWFHELAAPPSASSCSRLLRERTAYTGLLSPLLEQAKRHGRLTRVAPQIPQITTNLGSTCNHSGQGGKYSGLVKLGH